MGKPQQASHPVGAFSVTIPFDLTDLWNRRPGPPLVPRAPARLQSEQHPPSIAAAIAAQPLRFPAEVIRSATSTVKDFDKKWAGILDTEGPSVAETRFRLEFDGMVRQVAAQVGDVLDVNNPALDDQVPIFYDRYIPEDSAILSAWHHIVTARLCGAAHQEDRNHYLRLAIDLLTGESAYTRSARSGSHFQPVFAQTARPPHASRPFWSSGGEAVVRAYLLGLARARLHDQAGQRDAWEAAMTLASTKELRTVFRDDPSMIALRDRLAVGLELAGSIKGFDDYLLSPGTRWAVEIVRTLSPTMGHDFSAFRAQVPQLHKRMQEALSGSSGE